MAYEIIGVIAISVLILVSIWIASIVWAVSDIIKSKKPKKWIAVVLLPIIGAALYYFYSHTEKHGRLKRLLTNKWATIAIIIILLLSMYVRLIDYRWPYLRNIDSYVFYRWMDETVQNNGVLPTLDVYELAPVGF